MNNISRRALVSLLVGVLALTLTCAALHAQVFVASISGTVKDASGGLVPGAKVTIQNLHTGLVRELHTDDGGYYRASGLPLGAYEVQVWAQGFKTEVRTGISLTVERGAVVDVTLQVGKAEEKVVVTGEAPLVDTASAGLGELVDEQRVRELPLNKRDLAQLALLQPGVIWSRGSTRDINVGFGETKVSVAGSRPNQNLWVIDGADANDALNNVPAGAAGGVTGVETVKEFRVSTNTMSAEFGRVAGGVFNVVTKSGTNELHGSVFEFLRNDNLDARNFFDAQKPEFKRNQFGAAVGGRIWRDRTFFFASYEGFRERKGVTSDAVVPALRIQNATPCPDATSTANCLANPSFRILLPGPPGTDGVLRARAVPYLKLFPLPTGPEDAGCGEPCGTAPFKGVTQRFSNEDFVTGRIDHRFSESDSLFARYQFSDSEFLLGRLFPGYPNLDINRRQGFTLGETHVFTGAVVNEARFAFSRSTPAELVPTPPTTLSLLRGQIFGEIQVQAGDTPALSELGTDRTNPKAFFQNMFQVSDNLFWNRGRHSLKTGFLFERFQNNADSESRTRGRVRFRDLRRFLDGTTRDIEGATANSDFQRGYRQSLFGFYFQDDIRIARRLTLFAGLRWEFVTTPQEVNGKVSNQTNPFDPAAQVMVSDPRFASGSTLCCRPLFDNPTRRNFAPRLGLAWDIRGTGKSVLRSGFGIFYEQPLFNVYRNPIFRSLPFVLRARVSVPGNSVTSLPVNPNIFVATGAQETEAFQFDLHPTYAMQYNLNVQQDLGWNTILTLAYVGSRGVNLFGQGDTNLAVPVILSDGRECFPSPAASTGNTLCPGPLRPRRNANFGRVRTIYQGFNSWFNALTLGVVKHPTHGLTFQGAYTFARCLDERSGSGGRQEFLFGQARAFDPFHRSLDKGLCDFHVKHNFVLNAIYELPFGPGRRFGSGLTGAAAKIVEGWQIAGILVLASGVPFTPFVEDDPDNDGTTDNTARPNLVGNPNTGTCANGFPVRTPECWFNDTALGFPPRGIRGNLGRNTLIGPGLSSLDLSLVKGTRISERLRIEFRAEFFNIFNHTNFVPPQNSEDGNRVFSETGVRDLSGARIQARGEGVDHPGTSTTSREIQFALKFVF